jgi:signal transduction histidine kinase
MLSLLFRTAFILQGIWAVILLFPLLKGTFANLIKWGGGIYLLFMIIVQVAVLFMPGRTLLGLYYLHWFYLGTFIEIILFSFAISFKIKEAFLKVIEVRTQVARDLHDEIGASISGIKIFSQLAADRPEGINEYLRKINTYSDDMLGKMSDIVWTMNPENDNFEKIIRKIRQHAIAITSAKNIQLHFFVQDELQSKEVDMLIRKNIYLITKEAINNASKYAQAKNIHIRFTRQGKDGTVQVKDDGIGFDTSTRHEGNGLKNMRQRAAGMQGSFFITTQPGYGTEILLRYPIT